jgi:tripartite-type tricarboxylate transporter receptor subunit TctC
MNVIANTIAVVLSVAVLGEAGAQAFPSKPVRLIVGSIGSKGMAPA